MALKVSWKDIKRDIWPFSKACVSGESYSDCKPDWKILETVECFISVDQKLTCFALILRCVLPSSSVGCERAPARLEVHFCFLFMICLICTEMCLWTSLDFWFVSILRFFAEVLLSVHVPGDAPSGRSPIAYIAFVLACILVRSDFWDDVPISMARWNSAQRARYVIL